MAPNSNWAGTRPHSADLAIHFADSATFALVPKPDLYIFPTSNCDSASPFEAAGTSSCLGFILSNPQAEVVHGTKVNLGRDVALLRRESVPPHGLSEIVRQGLPGPVEITELQLSSRIAFLGRLSQHF